MSTNISLKKKYYGVKKAHNDLDRKFRELIPKEKSVKEFFRLYNKIFYELSLQTHNKFLNESAKYAFPEGYKHPKKIEEGALIQQLSDLKREIDSIEKEHFFFRNNRIIVTEGNYFDNGGNLTGMGEQGPYFMHSGKRRLINELKLYRLLKNKFRSTYQPMTDKETVIEVSSEAMNGITIGPPINSADDIYISDLEVNIFPLTLEEYEANLGEIGDGAISTVAPLRDPY